METLNTVLLAAASGVIVAAAITTDNPLFMGAIALTLLVIANRLKKNGN